MMVWPACRKIKGPKIQGSGFNCQWITSDFGYRRCDVLTFQPRECLSKVHGSASKKGPVQNPYLQITSDQRRPNQIQISFDHASSITYHPFFVKQHANIHYHPGSFIISYLWFIPIYPCRSMLFQLVSNSWCFAIGSNPFGRLHLPVFHEKRWENIRMFHSWISHSKSLRFGHELSDTIFWGC